MEQRKIWLASSVILGIVIFIGAVASLFYFFGSSTQTQVQRISTADVAGEEQKVIRMMAHWKGEDLREDFVMETVREFQTRNPDTRIEVQWNVDFPGGREGAIEEIIKQIKNGDVEWDVIWLEPFYYQKIADALDDQDWAKNHLVDFETVPGFAESQKSFIITDPQFRNHMNGVLTGPYIEGFYQPFYYNKVLADKIGLQIKESGMTAEDLKGYVQKIAEYNGQNGTDIAAFYEAGDLNGGIGYGPTTWNIFQSLFRSELPELKDLKAAEFTPEKDAALKKTLRTLEEIGSYKPLIDNYEDLDWFGTRNYMLDNQAVFTAAGASWMYSHWRGIDAEKTLNMVPVEMPVYQKVDHYIGGYNPMFAVMENSPVRDESVEFLMEFSKPNIAEKWVQYSKGPSGIEGNLSDSGDSSANADQYDKFISHITDTYGGNVYDTKTVDYILGQKYKDLSPKFYRHLVGVMNGDLSADDAYANIMADVKEFDSSSQ